MLPDWVPVPAYIEHCGDGAIVRSASVILPSAVTFAVMHAGLPDDRIRNRPTPSHVRSWPI